MNIATADLCDQFPEQVNIIPWPLRSFGGKENIAGEIVTLRVSGCNQGIIDCLETNGENRILVVENNGPESNAVTGDRLAKMAVEHNWQGIVIFGNIRDSVMIKTLPLGVWACGTYPMRGKSGRSYIKDAEIVFQNFAVNSGDWLYADADGVVVAKEKLG